MSARRLAVTAGGALLSVALLAPSAHAGPVEVEMLDRGPDGNPKVFRPAVVHVQPGDTVKFVAVDFGHDLQSIKSLQPEGAKSFNAAKNAGAEVTFEEPGVHVYQCAAHKTMGMVGVVVVGDPSVNLGAVRDAAKDTDKLSKQGKARLARMLDTVKTEIASRQ